MNQGHLDLLRTMAYAARQADTDVAVSWNVLAELVEIAGLARNLLSRLSEDYGSAEEGDNDSEVEELFERGEKLLPI